MQLAVISNDTRSGIESFLEDHGLSALFSSCWSADDQPRKPNPDAVHELCRSLNIPPKHCVLLGDAETDLSMARAAGVGIVIGYTGGWARQPELPKGMGLPRGFRRPRDAHTASRPPAGRREPRRPTR